MFEIPVTFRHSHKEHWLYFTLLLPELPFIYLVTGISDANFSKYILHLTSAFLTLTKS